MEMSATITSPHCIAAGSKTWQSFGAAKVTVTAAWMHGSNGTALEAFAPLGRSTATIGRASSFIDRMASAWMPPGARLSPVPKSASTTTSASAARTSASESESPSTTSSIGTLRRSQMVRFFFASPEYLARSPTTMTTGTTPRFSRCRATARPSPPFAPMPQKIAARSVRGKCSKSASTTAMAAFSISSSDGMPKRSVARRSMFFICSEVRIFIATPTRAAARPARRRRRTRADRRSHRCRGATAARPRWSASGGSWRASARRRARSPI